MPGSLRAGYVLFVREVRRLLHDPAALLAIIVAPFLLALITSYSLGARPKIEADLGVAGLPQTALEQAMDRFGASARHGDFSFRYIEADQAEALVRDGTLTAAVVVPADRSEPIVVVGARNEKIASEVATSIARTISLYLSGDSGAITPLRVGTEAPGRTPIGGAEVYGPVIAVFFILFGVGSVSRGLQSQRNDGTLERLLVAPIRPSVVLGAKGVMMFFVGVIEIAIVIFTTTLIFDANWGNLLAVAVVTVAVVLLGIAIATAIASFATSSAQAQGLELATALVLVGLGGHMVPLRNLPEISQVIARYTPNGAALDAYANIATNVGSTWSQLAPLVIVLSFTLVIGFVGVRRIVKVLPA